MGIKEVKGPEPNPITLRDRPNEMYELFFTKKCTKFPNDYREPYSPTFFSLEYGQFFEDR